MSSLGIFEVTGMVLLTLFVAPEVTERVFSQFVPIYTVLSVAAIILFARLNRSHTDGDEKKDRVYNIPRKLKPGGILLLLLIIIVMAYQNYYSNNCPIWHCWVCQYLTLIRK